MEPRLKSPQDEREVDATLERIAQQHLRVTMRSLSGHLRALAVNGVAGLPEIPVDVLGRDISGPAHAAASSIGLVSARWLRFEILPMTSSTL